MMTTHPKAKGVTMGDKFTLNGFSFSPTSGSPTHGMLGRVRRELWRLQRERGQERGQR